MPLITWINEIFPIAQEPFTVPEMILRLQQLYSPSISKSAVYRSLHALEKSASTAHLVKALDAKRPAQYSAESARRIARRVTHGLHPDRLTQKVKSPKIDAEKVSATSVELECDSAGTSTQTAIAA